MKARTTSFGETHKSLLDKIIQFVRTRNVTRHIPHGVSLLDLGCGYHGDMLYTLKPIIKRGVGIDLKVHKTSDSSDQNIQLIAGKVDDKLPFQNATFDIVSALAIIEHVHHPDIMLREMYRVLKPGGKIIITTPSLYGKVPLEIMAALGLISREEIADHKRYYMIKTLRHVISLAGFRTVQVKHFGIMWMNLLARAVK